MVQILADLPLCSHPSHIIVELAAAAAVVVVVVGVVVVVVTFLVSQSCRQMVRISIECISDQFPWLTRPYCATSKPAI